MGGMCRMTVARLLVSVRSAEEAKSALSGGADIIDVKEPNRGPLGLADPNVINEIVKEVGNRVPLSVALGEWHERAVLPSLAGVDWAKIGLSGMQLDRIETEWVNMAESILPTCLIGVCYADGHRVS